MYKKSAAASCQLHSFHNNKLRDLYKREREREREIGRLHTSQGSIVSNSNLTKMDDVEEELERIHSVSESVHSTTPRKTWFKEQIERAKYAMHLITLEFKDRDLERKYRNYTQNYRFWGARTTTLILWSVFFVTLICAAPVYKRNHTWSAWPTMFRLVQFSANFAFFYVPLLFMRRYPIPWLQKNWQMWFTLNTALSATTLIVTSAAIMESSTFGILRRCETEDLRTIVGHNFSCT